MVCSILLFTDGGANRGITQTYAASRHDVGLFHSWAQIPPPSERVVEALGVELQLLRTQQTPLPLSPTIFTFGFGTTPDAHMLTCVYSPYCHS